MKPEILTIIATFFSAAAQIFFKLAAGPTPFNIFALLGFSSYAISAMIFLKALGGGEISRLYPIWALSFIWVFAASIALFNETITIFNWVGIGLVIAGVAVIGGRKQ